jgi:hypothetical protein
LRLGYDALGATGPGKDCAALCQASLFLPFIFQFIFQAATAPSPERITEVVGSATRLFLAGYQAKKD